MQKRLTNAIHTGIIVNIRTTKIKWPGCLIKHHRCNSLGFLLLHLFAQFRNLAKAQLARILFVEMEHIGRKGQSSPQTTSTRFSFSETSSECLGASCLISNLASASAVQGSRWEWEHGAAWARRYTCYESCIDANPGGGLQVLQGHYLSDYLAMPSTAHLVEKMLPCRNV